MVLQTSSYDVVAVAFANAFVVFRAVVCLAMPTGF
jgi:hypothetical protein